jgi:hypothetical protein
MKQGRKNPKVRSVDAVTSIAMILAALVAVSACSTNAGSKAFAERMGKDSASAGNSTAPAKADPGINLNCIYDRLQNPRESFHYIYKKDTSENDHVEQEADITPQTIDGYRRQPDGSQKLVHGMKSDPQSWQSALSKLTAISGMSSAVAIVNHSAAMKNEPDGGRVNGYDTIHYSIDTSRFDAFERSRLLSPGEFEKGDVWVTSEGCAVKLALDSELHKHDGSLIEKLHYEEAMIKK